MYGQNPFIYVTCLIHVPNITHAHASHDSLINSANFTNILYVGTHNAIVCELCVCEMGLPVRHDSFADVTYSFMCAT